MNAEQAQLLHDAEKAGVKQIVGQLFDAKGGYCAMGVLQFWDRREGSWAVGRNLSNICEPLANKECPLCGAKTQTFHVRRAIPTEAELIVHYNNDHRMTFSEIARKLGPDSV